MDDVWATLSDIAGDRESGAAQIAAAAAEALRGVPEKDVDRAIQLLLRGHPTMAPLWRLASDVLSTHDPAIGANAFLRRVRSDQRAGSVLAPELPRTIITISFSSSVIEAVRRASIERVLCMRSEPGGEGFRMAAALRPLRVGVIEDQQAIELVPAEAVIVGADAVTPDWAINKVKTRALAEASREKGVPVYAVAGETKLVAAKLPVAAPFERVPLKLFTKIATPNGLLSPPEVAIRAAGAQLHPGLKPLLAEMGDGPQDDVDVRARNGFP